MRWSRIARVSCSWCHNPTSGSRDPASNASMMFAACESAATGILMENWVVDRPWGRVLSWRDIYSSDAARSLRQLRRPQFAPIEDMVIGSPGSMAFSEVVLPWYPPPPQSAVRLAPPDAANWGRSWDSVTPPQCLWGLGSHSLILEWMLITPASRNDTINKATNPCSPGCYDKSASSAISAWDWIAWHLSEDIF